MDTCIKNIKICEFKSSNFIKPFSIEFLQDEKKRRWDCIEVHDCVSILLYHTQKNAFLLVKQFRPSLWYYQNKNGFKSDEIGVSYELCSGIMDKNKSEKQTAIEEILEETGYKVTNLARITSSFSALGISASKQSIFFANIDESMKVSQGGGVDDEKIELAFIDKNKALNFAYDENIPKAISVIFAFMWYFSNQNI